MQTETMNPKIAALSTQLMAFSDNALDRPTRADRTSLMELRDEIKSFPRDGLHEQDARDINYLYVESTRMANQQEVAFESNGNKFFDTE